jgi:hypothetical protein
MNYFAYLVQAYGDVWGKAEARWNAAKPKIDAGTYTANEWTRDVLRTWLESMRPLWALGAVGIDVPTPVVGFNMTQGSALPPNDQYAAILPPIGAPVAVVATELRRAGGPDTVPAADVTASLDECILKVSLQNLAALPRGNYQGAVYVQGALDRMIALVHLVIE